MLPVKYQFHIARKRNVKEILLDFEVADFKHLVGLQYLRNVAMSRNSCKVYTAIKENKLTYDKIKEPFTFYVGLCYDNTRFQ